MNIQSAIKKASEVLKINNIKTYQLDSEILMSKTIQKEKDYIILNFKEEISKKNLEYFNSLIQYRLK